MIKEILPIETSRDMSPCKDCTDRYPACHDKCEKYRQWKEQINAISAERKKYNNRPFPKSNGCW